MFADELRNLNAHPYYEVVCEIAGSMVYYFKNRCTAEASLGRKTCTALGECFSSDDFRDTEIAEFSGEAREYNSFYSKLSQKVPRNYIDVVYAEVVEELQKRLSTEGFLAVSVKKNICQKKRKDPVYVFGRRIAWKTVPYESKTISISVSW